MGNIHTSTKIVCTIGPSVATEAKLDELVQKGMDVARLNFSHGDHREHAQEIELLKKARDKAKKPLAIMLDLKGPEIRLGKIQKNKVFLQKDQLICLVEKGDGSLDALEFHPFSIIEALCPGQRVLFDDGKICALITEVHPDRILLKAQNPGVLQSGKGMNVPEANLPLPAMTEADLKDLEFGAQHDVDFIAASFIRSAEHIFEIKDFLAKHGGAHIPIIAKIENAQGIENFESILQASDGIMVARGDLGVEVDLATIPRLQKMMIRKCLQNAKPVITATQMLESMVQSPRPTRAEVSDVANAIYDGTTAVMLSTETAIGKYPIETVCLMQKIAKEAEDDFDAQSFFSKQTDTQEVASSIALACTETARNVDARAIVIVTKTGKIADLVSSFRPSIPILAITSEKKLYHQLSLRWGVFPIFCESLADEKEGFEIACEYALKNNMVKQKDVVILIARVPLETDKGANTMILKTI